MSIADRLKRLLKLRSTLIDDVVEEIMNAIDSDRWIGNKFDDSDLRFFVRERTGLDYDKKPKLVQEIIDKAVDIVKEEYCIDVLP